MPCSLPPICCCCCCLGLLGADPLPWLAARQGNYIRARELYEKGLRKATEPSPYLYQSLGLLCQRMGLIEEARRWFRMGTKEVKGISGHAIWQVTPPKDSQDATGRSPLRMAAPHAPSARQAVGPSAQCPGAHRARRLGP